MKLSPAEFAKRKTEIRDELWGIANRLTYLKRACEPLRAFGAGAKLDQARDLVKTARNLGNLSYGFKLPKLGSRRQP